jgi:hypothetical protein
MSNCYFVKLTLAAKNIFVVCVFLVLSGFSAERIQAQTETIPAGSIIIDMGVAPQTINNSLRPYGLVYRLLQERVPVIWSINDAKVKDGVDFTIGSRQFRGGPFIIRAENRTTAIDNIINTWGGVVTFTTTAPVTVPVYLTLKNVPRWTMDKAKGSLVVPYFTNAGIPAAAYGGPASNWKDAADLDCCDDVLNLPHADPIWSTHQRLVSWNLDCKSAIWSACHAVSALENMVNPLNRAEQANFLTVKDPAWTGTSGNYTISNSLILWGSHSGGSPVAANDEYRYRLHSDPISQFIGKIDAATQNGSEQIYIPRQGIVANASTYSPSAVARWNPGAKIIAFDPTQVNVTNPDLTDLKNVASVLVYGRGYDDPNRGLVMYEGGHSHNKGTAGDVAAQRAFFNFGLLAAWDKGVTPQIGPIPSLVYSGESYPLSFTVVPNSPPVAPSSYTVTWSASCGGTFLPNNTDPNAVYIPPVSNSPINCVITATIEDDCGRISFNSQAVVVQCNIQVTSVVTNPCFGSNNTGVIDMTITNGSGPFIWSWTRTEGGSGNGTGTSITGLNVGTYSVTVTANNGTGCPYTFNTTLTHSPQIIINATPVQVTCNGAATGGINVSVSGGTPGYTYSWNDGPTTQNRSGLAAGSYTLTVTDSKGCQAVQNIEITQPNTISINADITNSDCLNANNGQISLTVNGGTPGYTFLWNDGNSNQNRTGLAPGTYSLTVTDANNCTATLSNLVITEPATAIAINETHTNLLCNGDANGTIELTVSGGTPGYNYAWTKTGNPIFNADTKDLSGLTAGTYNVTVTDANGCQALLSVTITQPTAIAISYETTKPTCPPDADFNGFDGEIVLTVTEGTGPYTFAWTASGTGVVPPALQNNQNLITLPAGGYTVVVTDANGCEATATITLTPQNQNPASPPSINN